LGKPVFEYSHAEYGGYMSKRTALWGYFNLPKRPILFSPFVKGNAIGKRKEISRDPNVLSLCPINFAMAFFEANP
jgi:hypothetical protein